MHAQQRDAADEYPCAHTPRRNSTPHTTYRGCGCDVLRLVAVHPERSAGKRTLALGQGRDQDRTGPSTLLHTDASRDKPALVLPLLRVLACCARCGWWGARCHHASCCTPRRAASHGVCTCPGSASVLKLVAARSSVWHPRSTQGLSSLALCSAARQGPILR